MRNRKLFTRTALLPFKSGLLPQTLNLFVTARCNATCEFCLYKHSVDNPTARSAELSVSEYDKIAKNYGPLHFLSISGGEPFIREDLAEICQTFIDHCDVQAIDIPSNFFYTSRMVSTLGKLVPANSSVHFELQLSVYHPDDRHDDIRGISGLLDKVKETLAALEFLRRYDNFKIKGNGLYLESNADELDELAAWFEDVARCDRFNLSFPQQMLEPGDDNPEVRIQLEKYIPAVEKVLDRAGFSSRMDLLTAAIAASKELSRKRLMQAALGERDTGAYCRAGKSIVVIDQEGNVFPCEPLWESVGNLRESNYELARILKGDRYYEFCAIRLGQGKCNCTWTCAINSASVINVKDAAFIGFGALRSMVCRRK
ncbi:radical SAM protein [Desulfovibrio sp. JC022]|uniref:radical SAM protein n=1 Tax=Desulfovibrio sp. JC022 TaxID=2593642 RepID=UPI0013D50CE0|nr:radical SAM protein [Desulfovibrio sp. JC022]NDV21372.1 radical SAM protein [Desulfovibrio sp. JC022]